MEPIAQNRISLNMKMTFLFMLTFMACFEVCSQNILQNGDFELYTECPKGPGDIYLAKGWIGNYATPDYFNKCDSTQEKLFGIPNNYQGYRMPVSGKAYSGIVLLYNIHQLNTRKNYKANEFIFTKINKVNIKNKNLKIDFSISLSDSSIMHSDSVYIFFFKDIDKKQILISNKNAHIKGIKLINDKQWQNISTSIYTKESYIYFGIGLPRSKYSYQEYRNYISKIKLYKNKENAAYYYIDNVSVIDANSSVLQK